MKRVLLWATVALLTLGACGGSGPASAQSQAPSLPARTSSPRAPGIEGKIPTRLVIPKIKVAADVQIKGLDEQRRMQAPDDGTHVAWYPFTSVAGVRGNAVFSGHLDYYNMPQAVFYNLHELQPGDIIEVDTQNGGQVRYRVVSESAYDSHTAQLNDIIGRTAKPSVTLYTCAGGFDSAAGEYQQRFVVRAEIVQA